jgi:hypothetical protein
MLLRERLSTSQEVEEVIMRVPRVLLSSLLLAVTFLPNLHAADMKAEDLVAKHLDAIGTPEARNAIKSRTLQGDAAVKFVMGGNGVINGKAVMDSTTSASLLRIKFEDTPMHYSGEQFTYDGKKVNIAMFKPGAWSPLGMFMRSQGDDLIKEGLFGGVLTSDWALLDVANKKPKLSYDGLKTVNGRSLHQLTYKMRKGPNDMVTRLYFEPETFRHVYSVYTLTRTPGLGSPSEASPDPTPADIGGLGTSELNTARQQPQRLRLEETFSDFVTFNGVTLPTTWKFTYTAEGDRSSLVHEYTIRATRMENNAKLEEGAFKPAEFPTK